MEGEWTGKRRFIDHYNPNQPAVVSIYDASREGEFTAGITGGLSRAVRHIRLGGEIRFTHWTTIRRQPAENEFFLLVGFAF